MPDRKNILIITYYWPPSGGAGVQRWLKFSKYLPEYGYLPHILTVDPEYAEYPAWDKSLISDINPLVKVHTTRSRNYFRYFSARQKATSANSNINKEGKNSFKNRLARFIRGNLFIPDPRKGWNKYAFRKAVDLINKEEIKIIITSGPPHSSHLIGRKIKRSCSDIKWIADFRDPWTDIYYYRDFYGTQIARNKDKKYELSVLNEADKIVTIGDGMKELLETKTPRVKKKIHVLPNGFDEEDFTKPDTSKTSSKQFITYVGSITDLYPTESFLAALSEVAKSNPDRKIGLRLVGRISGRFIDQIKKYGLLDICEFIDYTSHKEAIEFICSASILLLLIPNHIQNKVIITGKIFEYIRSGNAILGIGPANGDAKIVLHKTKLGEMFEPDNIKGIRDFIENKLHQQNNNNPAESILEYERKNITANFTKLLDF